MQPQDERRRHSRFPATGSIYIFGRTDEGPFELRGTLENLSEDGLAASMNAHLQTGAIVWCAAPSHSLYERAQVCYSHGSLLRKRPTGIRFLAPPPASD